MIVLTECVYTTGLNKNETIWNKYYSWKVKESRRKTLPIVLVIILFIKKWILHKLINPCLSLSYLYIYYTTYYKLYIYNILKYICVIYNKLALFLNNYKIDLIFKNSSQKHRTHILSSLN